MAALICILLKTLKGARVASSKFWISALQRNENCKKLCRDSQTRFTLQKRHFTAGLVSKKTPNLHIYAYANYLIISAMA